MKKKLFLSLVVLFVAVAAIKIVASFFMGGPFIYSDESCVVQKAMYFIRNFDIESCKNITKLESGGVFPLYSIIVSPIYRFFSGMDAYYAVLVLNSILVSTLVFPLFGIIRRFIKDYKTSLLFSFAMLFLSQVFVFEKMLLTEVMFIVVSIWFLYFYLNSFGKKKLGNKIAAVIFSILAVFTRPFGFILPIAMIVNELIVSKKKKLILIYFVPLILIIFLSFWLFNPDLISNILNKFVSLGDGENWILIIHALKNQLNSLTLATFLIPLIVFITYIKEKDSSYLKNISNFLIVFIILNFLISAQHIYGYLLDGNELHLLTRYVNVSLIYIFLFSFIFLYRYKKFKFNKINITALLLITVSFLFLERAGKYAQNIDLSVFYKLAEENSRCTDFISLINLYLLAPFIILMFLLVKNYRKILLWILIPGLLLFSILNIRIISQMYHESEITDYFLNLNGKKITYVVKEGHSDLIDAWKILALTDHKVDYFVWWSGMDINKNLDTDYIISEYKLDFPIELETEEATIYRKL